MSRGKQTPTKPKSRAFKPFKGLSKTNLHYITGVDYDYQEDRNCADEGCYEEGICRCSQIVSSEITEIDKEALAASVYGAQLPKTTTRAISVIFEKTGVDIPDNWTLLTGRGYYGEEIEGLELDSQVALLTDKYVIRLLTLPLNKQVNFAESI